MAPKSTGEFVAQGLSPEAQCAEVVSRMTSDNGVNYGYW